MSIVFIPLCLHFSMVSSLTRGMNGPTSRAEVEGAGVHPQQGSWVAKTLSPKS